MFKVSDIVEMQGETESDTHLHLRSSINFAMYKIKPAPLMVETVKSDFKR